MLLPVPTIASLLAAALALNLHYVLLGRPFLEGPLTSRPVLAAGNAVVGKLVRRTLTREGVPEPDRTETYSDGTSSGRVDIYEREAESVSLGEPRTAIVYFHSGAFIAGHRSFGAGVCGFFASHGVVCLSASYRLTNSGDGVAGCIQDAWAVLRWTRANAGRLNIDPSRVVVAGDSAGGLLATSLGTGLRVGAGVAGSNWPVTTLGSRSYVPTRTAEGAWEATGAGDDFPVESAFVPSEYGDSAERTQARLRQVLAGRFLLFGRRLGGLLPQPAYPADDAASVSPLWFASRPKLPPMLLLTGGADQVVPCDQTTRFAEAARGAGNDVTQLIFEEAGHGGGAVNCAAGRRATLDFLRSNGLLTGPERESDDPRDALGGTMRAFKLQAVEYSPPPLPLRPAATLRLRPRLIPK